MEWDPSYFERKGEGKGGFLLPYETSTGDPLGKSKSLLTIFFSIVVLLIEWVVFVGCLVYTIWLLSVFNGSITNFIINSQF